MVFPEPSFLLSAPGPRTAISPPPRKQWDPNLVKLEGPLIGSCVTASNTRTSKCQGHAGKMGHVRFQVPRTHSQSGAAYVQINLPLGTGRTAMPVMIVLPE